MPEESSKARPRVVRLATLLAIIMVAGIFALPTLRIPIVSDLVRSKLGIPRLRLSDGTDGTYTLIIAVPHGERFLGPVDLDSLDRSRAKYYYDFLLDRFEAGCYSPRITLRDDNLIELSFGYYMDPIQRERIKELLCQPFGGVRQASGNLFKKDSFGALPNTNLVTAKSPPIQIDAISLAQLQDLASFFKQSVSSQTAPTLGARSVQGN